uniref:Uncharacterized protein n=2 Tax=Leersia perrieri TaxID=77586 RepID=A0A0D9WB81_9ORYZ
MAMRLTCSCKCLNRNPPCKRFICFFLLCIRMHIMQGLLDQYTVAGNGKALVAMAGYFAGRIRNVIQRYTIERHWTSLDLQADSLSDFHANTHNPVVIGAQMRYEATGDPLYKEIATFFMDTVNSSHTYATGGTSVSRHLFRWTKEIAYADYYERALINGVLSIQRGRDPAVMIYMLPQGPGRSKAVSYHGWGTQYNSLGVESFSKLGDSIYFEEKGAKSGLYIIQYIPSTFNWRTTGLTVTQQVKPLSSSDQHLQVSLSISAAKTNGQYATLNVRIPSWTSVNGAKATLNDKDLQLASPGTFLTVSKQWDSGGHLLLQFPINLKEGQTQVIT